MSLSKIKKTSLGGLLCLVSACNSSPLKSDETVLFFPTSASLDKGSHWKAPIHNWVFEKEESSVSRQLSQKFLSEIIEALGASEEQANSEIFRQRLSWFLVDNERNKKIEITFESDESKKLNSTSPNGHAVTSISLSGNKKKGSWVNFKIINDSRHFVGKLQLIPDTGFSVISDIDDTIKISEVLDKKALIKNTFLEPYRTTKGMSGYYKKLQKQGAYFHYVSASPWQLYPSLKPFMEKHFPSGTIALRDFRLKDKSILSFLKPSVDYKITQIKKIIQRYPKHTFVLIGDSGEHDPEVYASIHKQFPNTKIAILIRIVEGSNISNRRFSEAFKHVPEDQWSVFDTPVE